MTKSSLQTKEYISIDFFKLIAAFMVFTIHIDPFKDINEIWSYFLCQSLCRIAVPFFFVASGYFLFNKLNSKPSIILYLKRIFKLYAIYTIIHIPQIIIDIIKSDGDIISRIVIQFRNFFFVGSFRQLWYFLALITSTLIIYVLYSVVKLKDKTILILCVVLYFIGTLGNMYANVLSNISVFDNIIHFYNMLFSTTRNGLFFGFPMVFIGCLIKKYSQERNLLTIDNQSSLYLKNILKKCMEKVSSFHCWMLFAFSLGSMFLETFIARKYLSTLNLDMCFTIIPTVIFLFLSLLKTNVNIKYLETGTKIRNFSTLFFGWHWFVHFYLGYVFRKNIFGEINSMVYYLIIFSATVILCCILLKLSQKEKFSFLKNLY